MQLELTQRFVTTRVTAVFLAAVALLMLAACSAPTARGATTSDPGRLVIYSGRSESLVQPIIDQFADATGIDVQVRYADTAELAGVLIEEGERSPADLFYAQDPGGLGAVQAAGLLTPLPASTLAQVPARFAAADGSWVGVSGRARVVVYNTDQVNPDDLPDDIFDFVDPRWHGRIGWAPGNSSFQTMVTGMRAAWGEARTREWLRGIQANEPAVFPKNTPIVAAAAAGDIDIGFVNHYYLYRFLEETGDSFTARNYFLPGNGPGSLIMVSGVGILETAPNAANAQKFVDYLLSLPGQQYFASQTYEYPVIDGVKTVSVLPALADLEANAAVDPATLTDLAGTQALLLELGIIE